MWKGLCVVHELLRGLGKSGREEKRIEEGVKEELLWWFEVLGHDLGVNGEERGEFISSHLLHASMPAKVEQFVEGKKDHC